MLKRLLSIFITVLMLATMCCVSFGVHATETADVTALSTDPTIVVSTASGEAGSTVTLTVTLLNNPGIASLRLMLEYDMYNLAVSNVVDGALLENGMFTGFDRSPYVLYWFNPTVTENNTASGTLATVEFTILDDAKKGQVLPIVAKVETVNDVLDKDAEPVGLTFQNGSIEIFGVYSDDETVNTYTYDFRNYTDYNYTTAPHQAISYATKDDGIDDTITPAWWGNSSGNTPYGVLVAGGTAFGSGYREYHNKMTIRGSQGVEADYYGGKVIKVREGYTYKVTVDFVPLDLQNFSKNVLVTIGLTKDTATAETKKLATGGSYQGHQTARGISINEYNVFRSTQSQIDYFTASGSQGGVLVSSHYTSNTDKYTAQAKTLTVNYKATSADAGSIFSIMVGSKGGSTTTGTRYISQILVTGVTIVETPNTDYQATFTEGTETSELYYSTDNQFLMPEPKTRENFAYWVTDNGGLYQPGDFVEVAEGTTAFKAVYIQHAVSRAFSYRAPSDTVSAGIRFRGEIPTAVVESAEDIGFAIIPKIAVPALDWYDVEAKTDKYTLFAPAVDFKTRYYAKTETGYQYQLRISDLDRDVLLSADFAVTIYVKNSDGTYSYYYIGCEDYNTVYKNVNKG